MKWLYLLSLITPLLSSCGGNDTATGPRLPLTIAEFSQPAAALLYVAEARGYLSGAGLDVTFRPFNVGKDALKDTLDGKSDLAITFQTPVVRNLQEGIPLGILASIMTSSRNNALVGLRERGIAKAGDLRGKKIGVTKGTSSEFFLSVFLATEGILPKDVTTVHVTPGDFEKTLAAGDVDALVLFASYRTRIRNTMGERLVYFSSDAYNDIVILTGLRQIILNKPDAIRRLMTALSKAQDYIENNRDDSIAIVARRLAGKFEKANIDEDWDSYRFALRLDHILLGNMRSESDWYAASGLFRGATPDFKGALVSEPLRAVRAASVTVQTPRQP